MSIKSLLTRRVAGAEHSSRRLGVLVTLLVLVAAVTALVLIVKPGAGSSHLADDPILLDQPVLEMQGRVEQRVTKGSAVTIPVRSRSVHPMTVTFKYFSATQGAGGRATRGKDDGAVQLDTGTLELEPGEKASVRLTVGDGAPSGQLGRYGVVEASSTHGSSRKDATKNSSVLLLRYPGNLRVRYTIAGAPTSSAQTPGNVGVAVRSSSNYALRPTLKITCASANGRPVTENAQASSSVLPGRTATVLFPVRCSGSAKVTAAPGQAGGTGTRSATVTITKPAAPEVGK